MKRKKRQSRRKKKNYKNMFTEETNKTIETDGQQCHVNTM